MECSGRKEPGKWVHGLQSARKNVQDSAGRNELEYWVKWARECREDLARVLGGMR